MTPEDEEILLKQAINGDGQAFASLISAHYDMIYRTAYKWIGNRQDAEDIAQDVCVKLGHVIRDFRMESRFSSWVYRIVLNAVRDFQRKRKPNVTIEEVPEIISDDRKTALDSLEYTELWQQVRKLPPKQCDAVLLVYAEELNHAEAAQVMQCKESTVSWHIHEAKKKLKEWMV